MKVWELNNHILEFDEEDHCYICDGVIVPCVSDILSFKFNDYVGVSEKVLNEAAKLGSQMHKEIELFEKQGIEGTMQEFRNYKFLKKLHKFESIENELPIIYEENGKVLYAGTLDQVIKIGDKLGINDFKRVASLNKEKVAYQLNLYKLGYEQTYKQDIDFLSCTLLRNDKRKFYNMPVNKEMALDLVDRFQIANNKGEI